MKRRDMLAAAGALLPLGALARAVPLRNARTDALLGHQEARTALQFGDIGHRVDRSAGAPEGLSMESDPIEYGLVFVGTFMSYDVTGMVRADMDRIVRRFIDDHARDLRHAALRGSRWGAQTQIHLVFRPATGPYPRRHLRLAMTLSTLVEPWGDMHRECRVADVPTLCGSFGVGWPFEVPLAMIGTVFALKGGGVLALAEGTVRFGSAAEHPET